MAKKRQLAIPAKLKGPRMRKMMVCVASLTVLSLTIGDATAGQPVGVGPDGSTTVEIIGHGTSACSIWLDEHLGRTEVAQRQNAWLFGFTSAFNVYSQNFTIRIPDAPEQVNYVTAWCKNHRTEPYATAAVGMVIELGIHEAVR